ncbi:hypothetical protein U472_09295 [Orenia metallireducens]|jgi:hypothetical protein|uniref:Uncharacterized protein n=1 Tax=Orenia metallireducens TaxID=1413210 RepID=A0A1C0A7I2_9FIRM|nr:hypothetical protein [Orenia metallireducens]OCL26197.1 hypothetical protein U472_09295 [Orenia metallireducens]
MDQEMKKDAVEMLLSTASKDLGISPIEFVQLAQQFAIEYKNKEDNVEIYREISPGIYRKVKA